MAALNARLQTCELIAHFDYTKGELLLIGGDVPIVDDNGRLIDALGLPGGTPEQDAEVARDATGYELILLGATKLLIAPASSTAAVKSRSDTECSRSAGDRSEPSGPFGNPECDVCHQSTAQTRAVLGLCLRMWWRTFC